jgi:RNA-directed DNA polymerase
MVERSEGGGMTEETIFTYQNLLKAYLDCRLRKRKTVNALNFEYELERNLYKLLQSLKARRYQPGCSTCFVVTIPTIREVFAADFRDRVIHHLFVNEIIEMVERTFCFESFACRTGKGTHKAVKRIKHFIPKVTENYTKEAYYLQLDLKSLFMSIDQRILYKIIEKYITEADKSGKWKEEMIWLAKVIIFNKTAESYVKKGKKELFEILPKRKSLFYAKPYMGLPIGNLTSQFFANVYLNEADQFIKRELKCQYYIRYVDDFIILDTDLRKLEEAAVRVDSYLKEHLGLTVSYEKTVIKSLNEGIDFLGYLIKPDYMLIRKKVVKRFNEKLMIAEYEIAHNKAEQNANGQKKLAAIAASYYGHFKHANAFYLKKNFKQGLRIFWKNINLFPNLSLRFSI